MARKTLKARKIYEKHHGVILSDDIEVHHIVPRHAGGTDDISNLVALTKEEHKQAHLKRYEETHDFRDLCAYHMIGYNFSEAHKISSSVGGEMGGRKVKKLGIGICSADRKLRAKWASMGGKIGSKIQIEKKIGIHGQTKEERIRFCSMAGKMGAFTKPEIQSKLGRRGGKKNKGFVWLTDGITNIKYTAKQQKEKSVGVFLEENPTFNTGRTEAKRKCSCCGVLMNARAIAKYHNERCKHAKNQVNNKTLPTIHG